MRYLYAAIGGTFDHAVSYPWVTYLFMNMTPEQVADITAKTIEWQKSEPVEGVVWESPESLRDRRVLLKLTGIMVSVWYRKCRTCIRCCKIRY